MPRYLVERVFSEAAQQDIQEAGSRMKRVAVDSFPEITWEHSHVVSDESGIKSFCVYDSPNEETLHQHGDEVGVAGIVRIYEIAGDVTPADFGD